MRRVHVAHALAVAQRAVTSPELARDLGMIRRWAIGDPTPDAVFVDVVDWADCPSCEAMTLLCAKYPPPDYRIMLERLSSGGWTSRVVYLRARRGGVPAGEYRPLQQTVTNNRRETAVAAMLASLKYEDSP